MTYEPTALRKFSRRPLAPLGKLAVIALIGMAAVPAISSLMLNGSIDEFTLPIVVIFLVLAALMFTGWRWATALAAVLSGLFLLAFGALGSSALIHPHEPDFLTVVLFLALGLVATMAGIGATVQNLRGGERLAPRWLSHSLIALSGLVLGAILVALIPVQGTVAGISPGVLEGLPPIRTEGFAFQQRVIRVRAGETAAFKLFNADSTVHSFDIDELDVHAPMPSGENGLALFRPTEPGRYTFYCSIPGHANLEERTGMIGTLIVEADEIDAG